MDTFLMLVPNRTHIIIQMIQMPVALKTVVSTFLVHLGPGTKSRSRFPASNGSQLAGTEDTRDNINVNAGDGHFANVGGSQSNMYHGVRRDT